MLLDEMPATEAANGNRDDPEAGDGGPGGEGAAGPVEGDAESGDPGDLLANNADLRRVKDAIQIGMAGTMMLHRLIFSRIFGHSSPSPSSLPIPGLTS